MGNEKKEGEGTPSKEEKPEVATKQAEAKKTAAEMIEAGLSNAGDATKYMKLIGLKPLSTYKGQPVTALFATQDGQFFYNEVHAKQHAKKMNSKSVFQVKID